MSLYYSEPAACLGSRAGCDASSTVLSRGSATVLIHSARSQ